MGWNPGDEVSVANIEPTGRFSGAGSLSALAFSLAIFLAVLFGGAVGQASADTEHLDDAVSISTGNSFSCGVRATGEAVCWGFDGIETPRFVPVAVDGLGDAVTISSGDVHCWCIRT